MTKFEKAPVRSLASPTRCLPLLSPNMAKAKSSASSATRKKHEKKAQKAIQNGEEPPVAQQPAQRGQKKKKNRFEPKVKSYVPPPPPPKGLPDPVDVYLAGGSSVDAELAVILRRLGKKDEATVGKGVEGLEEWVREGLKEEKQPTAEGDEWKLEQRRDQLVESMQVWVSVDLKLCVAALWSSTDWRLKTYSSKTDPVRRSTGASLPSALTAPF